MKELKALIDRKTGKKVAKNPRFVKQDQAVIATLQTAGIICVETFKDFAPMARFTLRDEGKDSSPVSFKNYSLLQRRCSLITISIPCYLNTPINPFHL